MLSKQIMEVMRCNAAFRRFQSCAHRETMKGDWENCPKAGASDALAKPVNVGQLLSD
jgi:hypothetical protein